MRFKANKNGRLEKSQVKAHVRRTKSGKMVRVKDYENKKKKNHETKMVHVKSFRNKSDAEKWISKNKIKGNKYIIDEVPYSGFTDYRIMEVYQGLSTSKKAEKESTRGLPAPKWPANTSKKSEKRIKMGGKVWRVRELKEKTHKDSPHYNIAAFERDDYLGIWDRIKHPDTLKKLYAVYENKSLNKSLTFSVTGQQIIDGLSKKIGEIKGKIEAIKSQPVPKIKDTMVDSEEDRVTMESSAALIEHCEISIRELERIIRNISPKQRFQLSEWELRKYNL